MVFAGCQITPFLGLQLDTGKIGPIHNTFLFCSLILDYLAKSPFINILFGFDFNFNDLSYAAGRKKVFSKLGVDMDKVS